MNDSDEGEVSYNMGSNCSRIITLGLCHKKITPCSLHYAYGFKVALNLQKSDITNLQKADAIVNFVYEDNIHGTMGILDKAGDKIKQQYETRRFRYQCLPVRSEVTMTAAGNLPYKAIFHVEVCQNSAKFRNAIDKVLRLADKEGMRSIAFPALQDATYVDSYFDVFYEYEMRTRPICVHMIDIICENDTDYEYHENELTKRGESLFYEVGVID